MTVGGRILVGAWLALGSGLVLVSRARADGDAMAPAPAGGPKVGEAPARLTPEMQKKLDEADKDHDGRIQPSEWPLGDATFRAADRDHDGALTPREILRYRVLEEARKNKAGEALRQKFREADKDGDGTVSRAEFVLPDALFARFDRDGDGKVSFVEALYVSTEEEVAKAFAEHDKDLSGTLSLEETPRERHEAFLAADADSDGQLTGAESHAFLMELQLELVGQGAPATATRPSDAPAQSSATKFPALHGAVAIALERFDAADLDHDGKIGRAELGASRALFERLDVDHDGGIDRAELRLRLRRGDAAIARAQDMKQRAQALGLNTEEGGPAGAEALGLLASGRVEELEQLLDEIDLVLDRLEISKGR